MSNFTDKERQALYAIFDNDQHEVRQGSGNMWFAYVRRQAIIERLDAVFFGEWETAQFMNIRNAGNKSYIDTTMTLAIRGVTRQFSGVENNINEHSAKSSETDAFKRIASMWGIGLYLQSCPTLRANNQQDAMKQLVNWLNKLRKNEPFEIAESSLDSRESSQTDSAPTSNKKAGNNAPTNNAPASKWNEELVGMLNEVLKQKSVTLGDFLKVEYGQNKPDLRPLDPDDVFAKAKAYNA